MKVLEQEISLRAETRTLQQARPAVSGDAYRRRAAPLSDLQARLAERIARVTEKIRDLPRGGAKFGREIVLLTRVGQVMREASGRLAEPETGPLTIAAETEAIELLLQARRVHPQGGGGGGGGSSPGGGGSGMTDQSALARIGSGAEGGRQPVARAVEQATGVSGRKFPEEYRSGLDAYFGALERVREMGAD